MNEDLMVVPENNIFYEDITKTSYRIYLTDVLESPSQHLSAIDLFRAAEEDDEIHMYITSHGGLTDISDMYVAAMSECKARIITHGVGSVCSAAVNIFLSGDECIPEEGSMYMIHNVQFGMDGDTALLKRSVDFYHRLYKEKYWNTYAVILNQAEMDELFDRAGEVYLTAQEMKERLGKAEDENVPAVELNTREEGIIKLPFPPIKVPEADNFATDFFTITLEEGYSKEFKLSSLTASDFDEYNVDELLEICEYFNISMLKDENTREDILDELIQELLIGNPGGRG